MVNSESKFPASELKPGAEQAGNVGVAGGVCLSPDAYNTYTIYDSSNLHGKQEVGSGAQQRVLTNQNAAFVNIMSAFRARRE